MIDLTIVLPCYNRALLLEKTLLSLISQSSHDFNVIVVDHGSNDNTRDIFDKYRDKIRVSYYWLEKENDVSGIARHFGASKVETPLIAFLDCGIVVPSFYVSAHCEFHKQYKNYIGLGMYHGHKSQETQDDRWLSILEQINIDEAEKVFSQNPDLCDERTSVSLGGQLPWICGWSGNFSMKVEDYLLVGGFKTTKTEPGMFFEDLDLCYRLFKHGLKFIFVENGWGIHLPHPRLPVEDIQKLSYIYWRSCYWDFRSLALEVFQYAANNMNMVTVFEHQKVAEDVFEYLTMLGKEYAMFPSMSCIASHMVPRPSLLIGGKMQDEPLFDYIALSDESIVSTSSIWSCCGIFIPLVDQSLGAVIVSDMWKWLGYSFANQKISLLENLIAEIKRTAQKVFFANSPTVIVPLQYRGVSLLDVEKLCNKHKLPFEIIQ